MELKALLVSPDRQFAERFVNTMDQHIKEVAESHYSQNLDSALYLASHHQPELMFIDETFGEPDLARFVGELRVELPSTVHILLTEEEGRSALVKALCIGARDYLNKDALHPIEFDRCLWGLLPGRDKGGSDDESLGAVLWSSPGRRTPLIQFSHKMKS